MRVLELQAENFKRLKAIRIRPDGALVQITGRNEEGKSSTLDALWTLLKGRAVAGPEPIRRGAERAVLAGQLGEDRVQWEVVRTFQYTPDSKDITMSLQVTEVEADGTRRRITKSPQAVLDGFLGALSFDPLAFARAKPAEQFDVLKRFVPGFDFERNTAQRKARFDERTDINRERDRARAAATTLSAKLPPGPKPTRVDVSAALERFNAGNAQIARNRAELVLRKKRSDDIRQVRGPRIAPPLQLGHSCKNNILIEALRPAALLEHPGQIICRHIGDGLFCVQAEVEMRQQRGLARHRQHVLERYARHRHAPQDGRADIGIP